MAKVSAVLLAAGSGRRMGRLKQLLPIRGRPAILHSLEAISAAGVTDVVVVTVDGVLPALEGLPVNTALNPAPLSDMAGSLRIGMALINESSDGVLVCLADHPLVSACTIRKLLDLHGEAAGRILVPVFKGRKGHPTLFPRKLIEELPPGLTLRDVVGNNSGKVLTVEVRDEWVVHDMDTAEDYERVLAKAEKEENEEVP